MLEREQERVRELWGAFRLVRPPEPRAGCHRRLLSLPPRSSPPQSDPEAEAARRLRGRTPTSRLGVSTARCREGSASEPPHTTPQCTLWARVFARGSRGDSPGWRRTLTTKRSFCLRVEEAAMDRRLSAAARRGGASPADPVQRAQVDALIARSSEPQLIAGARSSYRSSSRSRPDRAP